MTIAGTQEALRGERGARGGPPGAVLPGECPGPPEAASTEQGPSLAFISAGLSLGSAGPSNDKT